MGPGQAAFVIITVYSVVVSGVREGDECHYREQHASLHAVVCPFTTGNAHVTYGEIRHPFVT